MTTKDLINVVPPPAVPFEPFRGRWEPIELAIGTSLPSDYKDFARLYGSGGFLDFIYVQTPRTADGGSEFTRWVGEICRNWGHMERETSTIYWPTPGGLLPFASCVDGNYYFWLTIGEPEAWRVAVWDRGGSSGENIETFDCGFSDFLTGIARGDIAPKALPDDVLDCDDLFKPSWKT